MEQFFENSNLEPQIGMEMSSNETIKQAVIAGLGIAFISAHTVAVELKEGRMITLDITGLPIIRQWFVVREKKAVASSGAGNARFPGREGQAVPAAGAARPRRH